MPANEHVYQPVIRNGLLRGLVGEWQPLPQRLQAHYISGADVDQLDRPSTATYHAIALTPRRWIVVCDGTDGAVSCLPQLYGSLAAAQAAAAEFAMGNADG